MPGISCRHWPWLMPLSVLSDEGSDCGDDGDNDGCGEHDGVVDAMVGL